MSRADFAAAAFTLTLGILGSSVLPIPYAFSRTGVAPGAALAALIAAANSVTSVILINAACHLNASRYEEVVQLAAGGSRAACAAARGALALLLFGTLAGVSSAASLSCQSKQTTS
jgi:sodium-coupled neutral amino acid transporter 11